MKKFIVAVTAALTLIATPVLAKEGLYLGAYIVPTSEISGMDLDSGSGYGFRAGMGFNRYFAIEGTLEMSEYDVTGAAETVDLTGLAVDGKINFPLTSLDNANIMTVEPYIRLGYALNYELEGAGEKRDGGGPRFGFGIELYLFQELSVNAGWTSTDVSFDSTDADVRTFDIGLNYHFM